MEKQVILNKLDEINRENITDFADDVKTHLQEILDKHEVPRQNYAYSKVEVEDDSIFWKYLCANIYLLQKLREVLENTPADDVLSVQQTKNLRTVFSNLIAVGISPNLLKNLAAYKELNGNDARSDEDVLIRYKRLTSTIFTLSECIKCIKLRYAILPNCLKAILCGYYQINYCPLKKPSEEVKFNFLMTESIYNSLINERNYFNEQFKCLSSSVHKTIYVRETMLIVNERTPIWFKRAVSTNLNATLLTEDGLENIVWAMFDNTIDYERDDRNKTWKMYDIITKLIFSLYRTPVFLDNICPQVKNLLKVKGHNGKPVVVFERIFVLTVKRLYESDESLCLTQFLPTIYEYFRHFHSEFEREIDVTQDVLQGVHLIYLCYVEDDINNNFLPITTLNDLITTLYFLYATIAHKSKLLESLKVELKAILFKYVEQFKNCNVLYDCLLFGIGCSEIKWQVKVDIAIREESVILKHVGQSTKVSATSSADVMKQVIGDNGNLRFSLFFYCLNCLNQRKYLTESNTDGSLLESEDEFCIGETLERNIAIYKLLSELSEDKDVQKRISDDPKELIEYIENVIENEINQHHHMQNETEQQTFFTILMILQALTTNADESTLMSFEKLIPSLNRIGRDVNNIECKSLITCITNNIQLKGCNTKSHEKEMISEVDRALEDICDPLLPVRGHGLMTLSKLIDNRDDEAMNRKQYILNIFQQNLKNEDSFIYLSAIGGLTSMADIFPDVVLNTLSEEYLDFNRKDEEDGNETRLKLGEVLVRITKKLGDTATKYKTLLLNTFLNGIRDEDHLIRTSSLSNLGEICRVLGYKLGTIVNEVLECVHSTITTDKSIEARRAAVTVIRQLLNGLDIDMITFLKDELLEIYRTLKNIYYNDKDDIIRLHAQIALEELNENVKKFMFPTLTLNMEKNFVMLK